MREPRNPRARYFAQGVHRRHGKLLEELRNWEANPELELTHYANPGTFADAYT
jgi:hypothetical protein